MDIGGMGFGAILFGTCLELKDILDFWTFRNLFGTCFKDILDFWKVEVKSYRTNIGIIWFFLVRSDIFG